MNVQVGLAASAVFLFAALAARLQRTVVSFRETRNLLELPLMMFTLGTTAKYFNCGTSKFESR
jgi:hypothetical protein